jgi:hypothetical protein
MIDEPERGPGGVAPDQWVTSTPVETVPARRRIFLSHSTPWWLMPVPWAVLALLRDRDVEVFFDRDSIPPGVAWEDQLTARMSEADEWWVLWNKRASASTWVAKEREHARESGKPAVVVLLDSTARPDDLRHIQARDLRPLMRVVRIALGPGAFGMGAALFGAPLTLTLGFVAGLWCAVGGLHFSRARAAHATSSLKPLIGFTTASAAIMIVAITKIVNATGIPTETQVRFDRTPEKPARPSEHTSAVSSPSADAGFSDVGVPPPHRQNAGLDPVAADEVTVKRLHVTPETRDILLTDPGQRISVAFGAESDALPSMIRVVLNRNEIHPWTCYEPGASGSVTVAGFKADDELQLLEVQAVAGCEEGWEGRQRLIAQRMFFLPPANIDEEEAAAWFVTRKSDFYGQQ